MDLPLAISVSTRLRRCADLLVELGNLVRPHLAANELDIFSLKLAAVVGEIGTDLLFPVYAEYPQLDPFRGPARPEIVAVAMPSTDVPIAQEAVSDTIRQTVEQVREDLLSVLREVQEKTSFPEEALALEKRLARVLITLRTLDVEAPESKP